MSFIELRSICKAYAKTNERCIDNLDLDIDKGELIVVLGRSGCGKTTLLKIVSGLEDADEGTVTVDGAEMSHIPPNRRPVSMVFQKPLLFPNMTVAENINYAPRVMNRMRKDELETRTADMLALIDLEGYGKKKPTQLSGGQEQRVSLARALMTDPKILLLDEPLSALDAQLRVSMRDKIRDICKSSGQTVLFVTHDQQEAVSVADRIALMSGGKILQIGEPMEFYTKPVSKEVAEFFGWRNYFDAKAAEGGYETPFGFIPCERDVGEEAVMTVRPESFRESEDGRFTAIAEETKFVGTSMDCTLSFGGLSIFVSFPASRVIRAGETVKFDMDESRVWFMPKKGGEIND